MKISRSCYTQGLEPKAEHRGHHPTEGGWCSEEGGPAWTLGAGGRETGSGAQNRITDPDLKPRPDASSMLLEGKLLSCFCSLGDLP